MWSVMARSVVVFTVGWIRLSWTVPVVAASIPVLWSRVASVWIMITQAVMTSKIGLWSGLTSSVSILMVILWTWSGVVTFLWFVMCCWSSWRMYSVWAIHDNVTIFVTLIAPNVRAMSYHMSWFLTLETAIFVIQHHSNCGGWDEHCHKLLHGIQLLHFWDGIHECLRSLFVDVNHQTMGILPSFDKNPNSSSVICKVASPCLVLNLWTYAAWDSFSFCWISMKC